MKQYLQHTKDLLLNCSKFRPLLSHKVFLRQKILITSTTDSNLIEKNVALSIDGTYQKIAAPNNKKLSYKLSTLIMEMKNTMSQASSRYCSFFEFTLDAACSNNKKLYYQ